MDEFFLIYCSKKLKYKSFSDNKYSYFEREKLLTGNYRNKTKKYMLMLNFNFDSLHFTLKN